MLAANGFLNSVLYNVNWMRYRSSERTTLFYRSITHRSLGTTAIFNVEEIPKAMRRNR
jgi:hypothetical protein